MSATIDSFPIQAKNVIKKKWDSLQSQGNLLDHDRARLLHSVWDRLQKDDALLAHFLVTVLGEYPGKRCALFVRLVNAYDLNRDQETWQMVGGSPMVMLTRLPRPIQRKILVRVRETLTNTQRTTLSTGTFRTIVRAVIGEEEYKKVLTEQRGQSKVRQELALLKKFLLTLLENNEDLRRGMPRKIVKALGLDLVSK
jgi:hypothetical protein